MQYRSDLFCEDLWASSRVLLARLRPALGADFLDSRPYPNTTCAGLVSVVERELLDPVRCARRMPASLGLRARPPRSSGRRSCLRVLLSTVRRLVSCLNGTNIDDEAGRASESFYPWAERASTKAPGLVEPWPEGPTASVYEQNPNIDLKPGG